MRKLCLYLTLLATSLTAQIGVDLPLENVAGISTGYSCRPFFIFGTKTDVTMYPTHMVFLNIDGLMTSASDQDVEFFGGLGVIAGFSATHEKSLLSKNYYSDYYRLTSLNRSTGDLMFIGGNLRIMGGLPFSSEYSIVESYFNVSIECAYMGLSYLSEAGGFDNYISKKITESGLYLGLNLGVKLFLVDIYGGVGYLNDFYTKSIDLRSEVDDKKDEELSNPPEMSKHFVANLGIGIVFDLHRRD